ncbi:MAG: nicotinate (nicotinamide) nucleotide adenylyltransferase [Spirochaetales bacterium]|nr:nicotinate (nicotinamide) nucleotide adenylyltransferase [Spirochaetales bacterium]
MRNIIFGGTFDPVHIGHLHLAETVWRMFEKPRLFFLPSGIPPHKNNSGISSREQRIDMLNKALEDTPWELDLSEVEREGTTFTIDTIREMRERYGWNEKPGFILGDDLIPGFSKWKEPDILAEEVELLLACRVESLTSSNELKYPHTKIGNAVLPVSSSRIRERVAQGEAFKYLVPSGVFDYICKHKMYGYDS